MAKFSFLLSLATVLSALISTSLGVTIDDLFTVDSSCSGRKAQLNAWLQESIRTLQVAHDAINGWDSDIRVRRSMSVFFKINSNKSNKNSVIDKNDIQQELQYLIDFFNNKQDNGGQLYDKNLFWLFCGSDFLVEKQRTSTAKDENGQDIHDKNNNPVAIQDIPAYVALLDAGLKETPPVVNKPWWAGDKSPLNGYYFDDRGGTYCDGTDLGVTAPIFLLNRGNIPNAGITETYVMIICKEAFDGGRPADYSVGNSKLSEGINLADALPKGATLIHEAFHAIRGDEFLSKDEKYDIAACQTLANDNPDDARANPENYCFFITHMNYLFGTAAGGITTNWDFEYKGKGKNRIYAAKVPGGKDK